MFANGSEIAGRQNRTYRNIEYVLKDRNQYTVVSFTDQLAPGNNVSPIRVPGGAAV